RGGGVRVPAGRGGGGVGGGGGGVRGGRGAGGGGRRGGRRGGGRGGGRARRRAGGGARRGGRRAGGRGSRRAGRGGRRAGGRGSRRAGRGRRRTRRREVGRLEPARIENPVVAMRDLVPDQLVDQARAIRVRPDDLHVQLESAHPRRRWLVCGDLQRGSRREEHHIRGGAHRMARTPGHGARGGDRRIAFVLDHRPLVDARWHEREAGIAVELELELIDDQLRAAQDVPGPEGNPHPDRVIDVADVFDQQQSVAGCRRVGRGWRGKQRREGKPDETSPPSLH